jgi:hypothetical protein
MTNQEVFNRVWERAKDNRCANGPDGGCMYRNPDGLKCFIGHLIPDELYEAEMEGRTVRRLLEEYPNTFLALGLTGANLPLMQALQNVHDYRYPEMWERELRQIAIVYSLTVPA